MCIYFASSFCLFGRHIASLDIVRSFLVVLFFIISTSSPFLLASIALANDTPVKSASNPDQIDKRISLTKEEQAWLAQNHKVRVRVSDYPPTYFIEDGKPFGICIDLLNEVSSRSGVNFHFIVPSPSFKEDLKGLIQHTGPDLLPTLQANPEREKEILFTDPYFVNPRFIFTRDDAPFVSSIEELSGKTVAVENGFLVQKWLREKYPEITLLSFENTADALKALSLGKAFAYIGPIKVTASLINKYGYVNLKATAPSSLPEGIAQMGIRNDWPELQSIINKAIDSIPPEEKAQIINKWTPINLEYGIRPGNLVKWVLIVVGSVLVILTFFVVWNRLLRKQVIKGTAAVVESEQRFRVTFEQAAVGMAHVALDGKFLRVNKKFCDIVGYSHDEMLALTFQDITHPDDLEEDVDHVNELLSRKKNTFSMEKRYLRKDDAVVWVNLTVALIRQENGKPDWFVSVVEDISDQKIIEEALRNSEQKFRAMMEQAPFSIVINSPDGRITQVNKAFMEMWGISEEMLPDVIEKYNVLQDEEAKKRGVMPLIERAFRGEAVVLPLIEYHTPNTMKELSLDSDESDKRWVQVRFYPIKGDSGELINVVAIEEDVTKPKKAEEALQDSEQKFRYLVEQSPLSIQIINTEGRLIQVNKAFMKFWGISEEMIPELLEKYNILDDTEAKKRVVMPLIEKAFRGEAVTMPVIEYDANITLDNMELGKHSANKCWIQPYVYPIKKSNGEVVCVVAIEENITERKLAEEKILDYQQRLKALASQLTIAEEEERRRIAIKLHDNIGQALAFMRIKLAMAGKYITEEKPAVIIKELSDFLLQTIQETRDLIFNLSSPLLSEIGIGAAIYKWLEENVRDKHGINIEFIDNCKEVQLNTDLRAILFRNVRELLNNVIKHAQARSVAVILESEAGYMKIIVQDDGVGFDPDTIYDIFKTHAAFGLFSIRERMQDFGGSLEVVSKPGKGFKAILHVPVEKG